MTELMQVLFTYIQEKRIRDFLPPKDLSHCYCILSQCEDALLAALSDDQKELLEQYQAADSDRQTLEDEALFLATPSLARELS